MPIPPPGFGVPLLLLVAVALLLPGCEPTPKRLAAGEKVVNTVLDVTLHAAIRGELEARYAERFVIDESSFEPGLNMYQFRAHPRATPAVVVHGEFDERQPQGQRLRSDNYVNQAYSHAAKEHFASLLDAGLAQTVGASVYSMHQHTPGAPLLPFEQYLAARPDKSTIRLNRYVFHVPQDATDPVIAELRRNAEALQQRYGNQFSMYVGFWDPAFLAGRDPAALSFGFEAKKLEDADDLLTEMTHMKKYLFIKWTSGAPAPLSDEELFGLIRPDGPGPRPMSER